MEFPKFILTDTGHFRLGRVSLHKELLQSGEQCLGGGFYEFDYIGNRLLLSGRSYDFGYPRWGEFETLKVPEAYRGLQMVYFSDSSWEKPFIVSNEIKLEYID